MSNYSKVTRVLIGDGANSEVSVAALATIKKGDLVLLDSKNNILDATTAAAVSLQDPVFVAMGTGSGKFIKSSPIVGETIGRYVGTSSVAPVQKVQALGYNGTAGRFVVTAGEEYRLRILVKDLSRPNWQRPTMADANYTAKTGEDATSVASKLAALITQKDKGHSFIEDKFRVEVLTDGTLDTAITSCIVTYGSKEVFKASHGLTAGAVVSIAGATYTVAKVYGTDSFVLNMVYQGVSGSESVSPLTAITSVGIRVSAIEVEGFKGIDEYEITNFSAVLSGADDYDPSQYLADSTTVTEMNPGQGFWKQVFDAEMTSRSYLGAPMDRISYDSKLVESNVVEGTEYDSIVISHANVHYSDWSYRQHSPLQTEIYIPKDGAQGDDNPATSFLHILNEYVTQGGRFQRITL